MTIGKLNVILEVTNSLTERQYVNVLTIIKEGFEEELKKLRTEYRNKLKILRKPSQEDIAKNRPTQMMRRQLTKEYLDRKKSLSLKYIPSYVKAKALRYGKEFLSKHKKPLIATAGTAAVVGGLAAYNSKRRHDEAKKKLGLK